jgi:hypothetical protein
VTTRQDSISLNELYGFMLSYEMHLEQHKSSIDLSISTANTAQRQGQSYPRFNCGSSTGQRNNSPRGRGCGRGRFSTQQFSFSGPGSSQRPTCQVCYKQGHTISTCWFRFEQGYQVETSPLHANLASATSASDSSWYLDTGSNIHLTNDLSNLNLNVEEYTGTDKIRVDNDQVLKILHSGRGILPTPSHNFLLQSLFYVPKIQKIFISVSQFTHDNQVFIEFHPTFFCVKDLQTRQLLLKGPSRSGLYPWPSSRDHFSKSLATLIGEKVSLDQWHHRLGHPASPIVSQIIKFNKLPVVPSKINYVCCSGQQGKSHRLHFNLSPISSRPLQLLFLDVWGPDPLNSVNNNRYYLSIVDDFSKYTLFYPLKLKSDVLATFLRFKLLVETYSGTKITSVQSDNGGISPSSNLPHNNGSLLSSKLSTYSPSNGVCQKKASTYC